MIGITLPGAGRTEPARWLGQNVWLAFAIALVAQPTAVPETILREEADRQKA